MTKFNSFEFNNSRLLHDTAHINPVTSDQTSVLVNNIIIGNMHITQGYLYWQSERDVTDSY